jgi:O-antigen/teichoic acid export membrane protein
MVSPSADRNRQCDAQSIAISGTAVLLSSFFGNGLNYALSIFLARFLGAHEFGLYALGLTIFNACWLVALSGIDTGVIRFVSHFLGLGDLSRARAIFIQAVVIVTSCGALIGLTLAVFASPIAVLLYRKPDLASVLFSFSVAIPLNVLGAIVIASLQAFRTIRYTILIRYLWEPMGKFVLAGFFLYTGFGLFGVLLAIIITLFGSCLIAGRAIVKVAKIRINDIRPWRFGDLHMLLTFCLPLTISNLIGVVAPRSDLLMLGYFVTPEDIGIYLVAFQTAAILALILAAIEPTLAPILSNVWAQGDLVRLQEAYQTASRLTLLLTVPIYIVFVTFSGELLSLFGSRFSTGALVLIVLATGQIIVSSTGSANNILLMTGYSGRVMWNSISTGIVLLAAAGMLIPRWGILGASIAASTNLLLLSLVRVIQVWRLHRIQPYSSSLLKILFAGLMTAGVLSFMKTWISASYYPIMAVIGGIIYLGCLSFLGFEKVDRSAVKSIISKIKRPCMQRAEA